jgi:hypothetical protein
MLIRTCGVTQDLGNPRHAPNLVFLLRLTLCSSVTGCALHMGKPPLKPSPHNSQTDTTGCMGMDMGRSHVRARPCT